MIGWLLLGIGTLIAVPSGYFGMRMTWRGEGEDDDAGH